MTPGYDGDVPNQEKTPRRTIRIDDELWRAAQAEAKRRGVTISDVVRDLMERFVRGEIR